MIAVRLRGGLGNQLFQYAAARRLSLHHGTETVLDLSWFGTQRAEDGIRLYGLEPFAIRARTALIDTFHPRPSRVLARAVASRRPRPPGLLGVPSATPGRLLRLPDDTFLYHGHFQSERYFAPIAAQLRDELSFRAPPDRVARPLLELAAATESVSLHVRRTDYVTEPAMREWYAPISADYYAAALDALARRAGRDLQVIVISDDPDWCREHLGFRFPTAFSAGDPDRPHDDLRLMSACRHHVIVNSTFSWWGAWLNPRPDKTVIAPARWVKGAEPVDVIPGEWLRLAN